MSSYKRQLISQEDAQCVVCSSGDYEEDDLIVFCGNCGMPVHQSCYGIDEVPEGDWICYNCEIFGFKRGLCVPCFLCPRRGGAMKPTNVYICTSQSNGSKKQKNIEMMLQAKVQEGREDKSMSINSVLKKEFEYQIQYRGEDINMDLQFDPQDKELQIPEDYQAFIQKNSGRLESQYSYQTNTLYEWVHQSCAQWIHEISVTPRTPVKLSKLDQKRFTLQCFICLKKDDGACVQCTYSRCMISFHVECAKRARYFMEVEKRGKDKTYRLFCEKHRPLKIVKEMEEKDKQTLDEIHQFCKTIEKGLDIE